MPRDRQQNGPHKTPKRARRAKNVGGSGEVRSTAKRGVANEARNMAQPKTLHVRGRKAWRRLGEKGKEKANEVRQQRGRGKERKTSRARPTCEEQEATSREMNCVEGEPDM